jgi:glycosyltransferase involved in cell wall biosynthesis
VRIAYITETYPPEVNGVALTTERAVRHLRQAGHSLWLVRPRQRGEAARDDAHEWRCPGGPIPMYPELRFGMALPVSLRRRWRADPPDLVHVATPGPLAWAALLAARAEGLATSADFRTNFHAYSRHYGMGALAPVVLAWLRRLHAKADCTFVPTPALARDLSAHGFERLQVVGRGVDTQRFTPARRDAALRASWGAQDGDPVLLHVGRLAAEKNAGLALRCFEWLRGARPALRMVVVGDGPLRGQLQAAHPAACFVGLRQSDELARHYASADLFLFPSLTDTFGNVTLEALASGLALVAFDTAAAAVHARDGHSACLAPAGDNPAFFAAGLRALQQGTAPDGVLRRQARDAALKADWEPVLRQFDEHLRAVAGVAGARRVPRAALA